MNITLIIIIFLIMFTASLILLNLNKIKEYFAKFKKSKKKKSGKGKGKKDKNGKNVKLQKSPTQTRPVVKPPEEKKPEDKEEQNKDDNNTDKTSEYKNPIKPVMSTPVTPTTNTLNNPYSAFEGSKFNKTPTNTLKDDLDKEFDEIRRYINNSPTSQPVKQAPRPSFFGPSMSNMQPSQFKNNPINSSSFIQPNRQNPYGVYNQNSYPNNINSKINPFMQNSFPQKQSPMYNAEWQSNFPTNFNGGAINNMTYPPSISANRNSNSMLNIPKVNPFAQKPNNFNINNNLITPPKSETKIPVNAFESLNLDAMSGNTTAKVKIDDDEIDLNKLSPKVKKLIISNILARKNFDD